MLNWFARSSLFAEDGAAGGGVMTVNPGDPVEHDYDEPEPEEVKLPGKSDADKRIEALEADLADQKRKTREAEEDSRHWATTARRNGNAPRPAEVEQEEAEPESAEEKPEKLLDDVSTQGAAALKKRGFVTKADVKDAVKQVLSEVDGKINATVAASKIDQQMGQEFPELVEDSKKIAAAKDSGRRPDVTPLFTRASEIYRAAVALDPTLEGSTGALLISARQAKAELASEAKTKTKGATVESITRPQERRSRIEQQRPARAIADEGGDDGPTYTPQQQEVMKRLHVSEKDYGRQREKISQSTRRTRG